MLNIFIIWSSFSLIIFPKHRLANRKIKNKQTNNSFESTPLGTSVNWSNWEIVRMCWYLAKEPIFSHFLFLFLVGFSLRNFKHLQSVCYTFAHHFFLVGFCLWILDNHFHMGDFTWFPNEIETYTTYTSKLGFSLLTHTSICVLS